MKKYIRIIVVCGVGVLFAAGVAFAMFSVMHYYYVGQYNLGQFVVVNKANQEITKAVVQVCGETFNMEGLKQDEVKVFCYKLKGQSSYKVKVTFPSGKRLIREIGYVTIGIESTDALIIEDEDVKLDQMNDIRLFIR